MKEAEMDAALRHPEDHQRLQQAYAAARTRIAELIQQNGRETVLQWLNNRNLTTDQH
jgi:predicted Zn-dependent protease